MLKRKKKLQVNSYLFDVVWDKKVGGGSFNYTTRKLTIGTRDNDELEQFMILSHELSELAATECHCRFNRPDCDGDFIFCYDHRQHDIISNMASGWLWQFLGE